MPDGGSRTWATSGAMCLTGHRDGPALAPQAPVGVRIAEALLELERILLKQGIAHNGLDAGLLLSSRAHHAGWKRQGTTSVNGTCRLLRTRDAWVALNLARQTDIEAVPALIEEDCGSQVWAAVARRAAKGHAAEFVARAQLLGIPASVLGEAAKAAPLVRRSVGEPARVRNRPLVVDLSAMWAGPLCARILGISGAQVVKVETWNRPDGARFGPAPFYDWLHEGHCSVAVDFKTPKGQAQLRSLLQRADVVIDSSRPRALESLGIRAVEFLSDRPGRTWVSITGYGRSPEGSQRVAFGDDAAVAGGLVAFDANGDPVFCADAIADPLTGLFAGIAALQSMQDGGSHLLEVSMSGTAAWFARRDAPFEAVDMDLALAAAKHGRAFPAAMPARIMGSDNPAWIP